MDRGIDRDIFMDLKTNIGRDIPRFLKTDING